jgi:flagellar hook-associated protein 3 FlgL
MSSRRLKPSTTRWAKTAPSRPALNRASAAIRVRYDYLTRMIADIEDADMAEAASRLNQAQTAVEVSARTFASLSQVSLLPFLR